MNKIDRLQLNASVFTAFSTLLYFYNLTTIVLSVFFFVLVEYIPQLNLNAVTQNNVLNF